MATVERTSVLSVAPMIQWTDRHWRFLMRQITQHTLLYTEMTMDSALTHNPQSLADFIGFTAGVEEPLAVQLGGNTPATLGEAAYLCESFGGFEEINLNCGCPSNKAKKAGFGAELMLEPELVREILHEMKRRVTHTKITVKCRLGVTGKDSWEDLLEFVQNVRQAGITSMVIHSRSCVLRGLSPAQNRTIPPLRYDECHKLVKQFPDMQFTLNGGIATFEDAQTHLGWSSSEPSSEPDPLPPVHGVMIGREAYRNPWLFRDADSVFFDKPDQTKSRRQVLEAYLDYCQVARERGYHGSNACNLMKPLHNFFHGAPSKANQLYKRQLDDLIKKYAKSNELTFNEIVMQAIEACIPAEFLDATDR